LFHSLWKHEEKATLWHKLLAVNMRSVSGKCL